MKKSVIYIAVAALLATGSADAMAMPQAKRTKARTAQTTQRRSAAKKATPAKVEQGTAAELGKKYFDSENYEKAVGYVKKAAAEGDLDSQVRLADMNFFGNGVDMDRENAHDLLDQAIEKGSTYAMERKGFYLVCEGQKQEGFDWFKKAADAGNADASVYVMNCYRTGDFEIIEKNEAEAAKYCKLAAEQGSMEGQAFYGLYLLNGEAGVEQNEEAGIEMIEKAYAKSDRNSFEKNCPEAGKALVDHYKAIGETAKAETLLAALKKYHPEKY